ncbi:arginine/serine-rich protein 1 [Anarrhichthys ocellatus]|uniref:arginine/serine-rich protein 1 n=1 Tax=Anarrhichthys ocellatus TaxID=433405 RepID=UPI0012ED8BA7|nr:arginine/serine-rich protein 1-like [Anarrhichthys ocellatus]
MTKGEDSHSEIAHVRQSDGINVIFDQKSPAGSRSRSKSSGGSGRCSGRHRGRNGHKGGHRSHSSSSRSRSSSRRRSRSHPRCHRPSSRCRCDNHRRHGRGCGSPPRRHRAHHGSPSASRHRRNRSRSKPSSRRSRHRTAVSRFSQSPPRNHRSSSGSGSSEHSVNLSCDDKGKHIKAAKANATTTVVVVEKLELPEIVKPILSEPAEESKQVLPETRWVRQDPEKTLSESDEESDDMFSPRTSPKRKTISFSINNSMVKPTAAAPSGAKVTSRMDSYESRKPYGHWKPVKSGHASRARKHALAGSP